MEAASQPSLTAKLLRQNNFMASRIPPLLEPYLGLPTEASLIVLSSVLGASTNWLVQRYLCSLLGGPGRKGEVDDAAANGHEDTCVVLVSFMRDYAFWKEGAGRLGLDLDGLLKKQRFKFVDGLSGLFSGSSTPGIKAHPADQGHHLLRSATASELQHVVLAAVQTCATRNVVSVMDNPDLLLAAAGDTLSGEALREAILNTREVRLS